MRSTAVLSLLVCGMVIAGCGGAQSRLQSHMVRGKEYYAQGDYLKAGLEFRNALQIAPKDVNARLMGAHAGEHLGQFNVAISLYQAVVDTDPTNADAAASLGRLLAMVGASQQALKIVEPALKQHPDDPDLLASRAAARLGTGDKVGATEDADRAVKLAPTNENAVALRANLYRQAGDNASAIAVMSAAVQKTPDNTTLRELLAALYAPTEPAKAEEQLREIIKLRPKEQRFRNALAGLYVREKRLDAAQQVLEDSVKSFPDNQAGKIALVDFLGNSRSLDQGEQKLREFIAKTPDNYDLRLHLGAYLQAAKKPKEALVAYQEIVSRAGTEPAGLSARDKIASMYLSQQQTAEASKLIDEVLQKNPRDNEALALRGRIALEHHDPVAAIGDFRAVLRDQPRATGIQRLLAQAYAENGELELAADALRSARQGAPNDPGLRIELAQLLLRLKHNDESVKVLEEGVHNSPQDPALRESLVRAYIATGNYNAARTGAQDLETVRPEVATGWYLAGLAAQADNQLDEAQKQFEHALTLQPRSLEVLSALTRLDVARKHPDQAVARLKSAVEHDPNGYTWNLLGELYLSQKTGPAATDALTQAIKLVPKWATPYRNLALAKLMANDTNGAIAEYDEGLKVAPGELGMVTELATLLEKQGRIDDAIGRYESVYASTHNRAIANNLAMLLVTYRKDKSSLDRARDLTRGFDTATEGDLLDTTGWVHFKRAEYADALPTLERAAQRAPDSPVIRYHLGMAELQAGRTERARADLQTAVSGSEKFPGEDEARTTLASLKSGAG